MISFDFTERVALVTGGSSGIGRAVAGAFVAAGGRVVVAARRAEQGRDTVKELGARASFIQADVRDEASVERMVGETVARFGRLDLAVNAAGIGGDMAPLETASLAAFDDVLATNARGVYLAMRFEALAMLRAETRGAIVNIASIYGETGRAAHHAYVAAKHAVVGLTKSFALELAPRGIRVNAIAAGATRTAAMQHAEQVAPELVRALVAEHPIGRMASEAEIAAAVLYLASSQAASVVGASLPVDGGFLAR
jgi:NAD(P)-dependent dehydrogenase (short-subunit alcohol dehydrogenase family)